jgi:hypothetical protein
MDITPAAVVGQQMASTQNALQMQVLKKVLDMQSQQGSDLARMVQQAAGLGQSADFLA